MGAPELPEPTDDSLRPSSQIHMPISNSDDSDNEAMDAYNGYEPLPMTDDTAMDESPDMEGDGYHNRHANADDRQTSSGTTDNAVAEQAEPTEVTHGDPNLPHVESVDVEITRQVWSEPRPQELQIELDTARTAQILNAMANFQLPNVAVPEWAAGIPEERWKEELLQRIRQRKDPQEAETKSTT